MQESHISPHPDRLSVVAAVILLAYALLPFVQSPARQIAFELFGVAVDFQLNYSLLISIIAAALAAAGTDWLVRDHPKRGDKPVLPHYLLPALTGWVLGIPLGLIQVSIQWWVVFALGGLLLLGVLIAEFISIDAADIRYPLAVMILTAVGYGLILTTTIAVRAAGMRLYLLLITLVPVYALISLRIVHLRSGGKWLLEWAIAITLVVSQVAIGLHYWPLSPIRYGLILLGLTYAFINLAISQQVRPISRNAVIESLAMLGIFWLAAVILK
jgi:hypothetical protein